MTSRLGSPRQLIHGAGLWPKMIRFVAASEKPTVFKDKDNKLSLIMARIDTLVERRQVLTERFFRRAVMPESSCLYYFLPDKRVLTF